MEIPKDARKCPYCLHFQNLPILFLYHPVVAVLSAIIPGVCILIYLANLLDTGEKYETYKDQIVITESQLVFGEMKSGQTVGVIGTIRNTSPISWNKIQFHVDFLDAKGNRIDVGQKEQYTLSLPANEISSFKLSFPMEFPKTNYIKANVSVVAAKDAKARW